MRILGVDYGLARIGLAMSDPTGLLAQSFSVLKRVSDERAASDIADIVAREQVELIVVGLPKHMNGSIGERALQCQAFAERLQETTGVPTEMMDERLTTVAAERMLIEANVSRKRRKEVIDAVAATVLLQSYLDQRNHRQLRGD